MPAERCAAYGRCSDPKQEMSCEQQHEWAAAKAAALKMELAAYQEDEGIPGDVLDRPGLNALFDDLEREHKARRPVPVLLLFDQDRLSRATSWATGAVMERLMLSGVERIVTATEEVDLYDDGDRAIYDIKQNIAKRGYVKALSKNVARGSASLASQGFWVGGDPPYGFRIAGEPKGRYLVRGPEEEVAALEELFGLAAEGHLSLWALARVANERHWPVPVASDRRQRKLAADTAPRWTESTVRCVLRQPAYVGLVRYGRRRPGKYHQATAAGPVERRGPSQRKEPMQLCKGKHDGLIEPALFDRVQATLTGRKLTLHPNPNKHAEAERKRRRERARRGTRHPEQFVFRHKLTCACCGAVMQGSNQETLHGYVCSTWKRRGDCYRNHVHEAELLDRIALLLAEELDSKATLDRLRKRLEKGRTNKGDTLRLAVLKGKKHVADLERQVEKGSKRLLSIEDDLLPEAQGQLRRLKAELETGRHELALVEKQADASHAETADVEELIKRLQALPKLLRDADPDRRANVVRMAVSGVVMRFQTWQGPTGRKMSKWVGATVALRGNGPTYEIDLSRATDSHAPRQDTMITLELLVA